MSSTCQFRSLPKHILESICKYAMPITEDNTGPRPGVVMLRTDLFDSLGPEWREVALEHYFSNFILAFNNPYGKVNSTHPLDDGFISVSKERHAVTSVKIYVALDDLLSGKAACMLRKSGYSSLVFPSVVRMTIDISEFHESDCVFHANGVAHKQSFYEQLMVMFPGVKKVKLLKGARSVSDISTANCEFEQFVVDLFTEFSGVSATFNLNRGMDSMWSVEDMHTAVTEMALFKDCYTEKTFKLLHKCAPYLKTLDMHYYTGPRVFDVFTDANGKPVEYPRLTAFNLCRGYDLLEETYEKCPKVLLPSLTHLTVDGGFPFATDVLFSSVSRTLKYASVEISKEQLLILTENRVFQGLEYPNVRHVEINYECENTGTTRTPEEFWPYIYSIMDNIRGFTIPNRFSTVRSVDNLIKGPALENIEYLKLAGERITFTRMCSVIEKLPQMEHLYVGYLMLDYKYKDMSRSEIYDDVTSMWPVLSHRLRYCNVVSEFEIDQLATCGMLLAAICPGITRFESNSRSRELIQEEINHAIKEEPFSRYADKLKYLTYNGIPEGSKTFAAKQVYW